MDERGNGVPSLWVACVCVSSQPHSPLRGARILPFIAQGMGVYIEKDVGVGRLPTPAYQLPLIYGLRRVVLTGLD